MVCIYISLLAQMIPGCLAIIINSIMIVSSFGIPGFDLTVSFLNSGAVKLSGVTPKDLFEFLCTKSIILKSRTIRVIIQYQAAIGLCAHIEIKFIRIGGFR